MKRLVFIVMLAIMGNIFATPVLQKDKNVNMTKQTMEREKNEIEKVFQKDIQPLLKFFINTAFSLQKQEIEKDSETDFFDEDYILSKSLKSSILENFMKEFKNIMFKSLNVELKKIDYTSNDEAEIVYDIKIKNIDKLFDNVENEEEIEQKIVKKLGYSNKDEVEKIMKSKGNDDIKKRFYNILTEEMMILFEKNLKNIKSEETILENMSVKAKKVNGKWKIEDPEDIMNNFN